MPHVDRERILKRIVYARGSAAHGRFRPYKGAATYSRAAFLQDPAVETPIFVRFSTIASGAGPVDPSRDLRRFVASFYTANGIFDLAGNNSPVFFAPDEIACSGFVHSMTKEPDPGLSRNASTYDIFWGVISRAPESLPMVMWVMSDRAIPRSYRMMEGFGRHTFRMVDARGGATFTAWRWRPVFGTQSVRREGDRYPAWELAIQPLAEDQRHDLGCGSFDPTRRTRDEQRPWIPIGRMVLDRWQNNFFSETEEAAFHPGRLVPGIEVVDDPRIQRLSQHRAFSYLDRQLNRLGGCDFHEWENSHGSGMQGDADHASCRSSRADHYSQARTFWRSVSPLEQRHITSAFTFELSQIEAIAIQRRMLGHLDIVDPELGGRVADALGTMVQAETVRPPQLARASRPWSRRRSAAGSKRTRGRA